MLEIKNVSSLEKVFPEKECNAVSISSGSALLNEEYSYQVLFKELGDAFEKPKYYQVEIDSDISECITIYTERYVPVINNFNEKSDENYITHEPYFYPDVLEPFSGNLRASDKCFKPLWVNVRLSDKIKPGEHTIRIIFKSNDEIDGESVFTLDVINAKLPKLDIPYTDWLHTDCIATYHGCGVFTELYWKLVYNYIKTATENGVNMILTPIFTPPLDTMKGAERPTVQLVDVFYKDGVYSFGFEKLLRWLDICKQTGIEYIEISHLYSQWGAEHTPKIEVNENGTLIKKFGWHTDALSEEYKEFIRQLLPDLKRVLEENWNKEKVYFHISDEPNDDHINHYGEIYKFIKPLLGDFKQFDAMSDYELYEKGFIEIPVVATDWTDKFIKAKIDNMWVYYCCGECYDNYSNRFIAMPSYRNRILGMQLYKYNVKGFLHWGYNFYYSQLSVHPINPYVVNDADGGFPAGDAFCVYPSQDGAIPSIRIKVFNHGMQDMMAAKLLESLTNREEVMNIIEEYNEITFNSYPFNSLDLLKARETINCKIKQLVN